MKSRLRLSILSVMILIALAAGIMGWVAARKRAAEKQRQIALIASLQRQVDRLKWAEDMQRKGYLSKSALNTEHYRLSEIEKELRSLGVPK